LPSIWLVTQAPAEPLTGLPGSESFPHKSAVKLAALLTLAF
jgi:hypothetical protein